MIKLRRNISLATGLIRLCGQLFWNFGRVKVHGCQYFCGKGTKINVSQSGCLDLGKKNWFDRDTYISANGKIELGYNNFFNSNCKIVSTKKIEIGSNNLFGPNVVIVDHNHRFSDSNQLICKQGFDSSSIKIGSDIWVGANVTICSGVEICDRVVVGANAVVTKSLSEPGVYVGNPLSKIKSL